MEFLLNLVGALRNLGKSKRFLAVVIEMVFMVVVELYPNLDPAIASQLQEYSLTLTLALLGGYSVQDAAKTFRTGATKYDE